MAFLRALLQTWLLPATANTGAEAWWWGEKAAPLPPFSLDELEVKVNRTVGKLLFRVDLENETVYSGVAGGNQFSTIWVRDFCHASGGLLKKHSWPIGGVEVESKQIVLSTLKAILELIVPGEDVSEIKIPRALDSLGPEEERLTLKVLKGGAVLKQKVTLPWGEKDPGRNMNAFPGGKLYGYFQGEGGASETSDAGYLLVLAFTRVAPKLSSAELSEFLESHGQQLRLAVEFYSSGHRWEERNGKWLFTQSIYSEWKDSCKQEGISSFSNLQLIEALTELVKLMEAKPAVAQAMADAKIYAGRFGGKHHLGHGVNGSYATLLDRFKTWTMDVYDHFYDQDTGLLKELDSHEDAELFQVSHIDSNLQWQETNKHHHATRSMISMESISKAFIKRNEDNSIRTIEGINTAGWPHKEVSDAKTVIGLYQYHGTFAWSWWTCWFAERAALQGNATLAEDLLDWVWRTQGDSSLRDKKFFDYISEVYSNTHIVNALGYVSETPFLWGSSYCVRAIHALRAASLLQVSRQAKMRKSLRHVLQADDSAFMQLKSEL